MYKKILVALDNSQTSRQVFEQALDLGKSLHAQMILLRVLSSEAEVYPLFPGLDFNPGGQEEILQIYLQKWKAYQKEGLEFLQSFATEAIQAGVETEFIQKQGSPGRQICALARAWKADLIVLGRRGHSGLNELILGSVSNYVLHHAPCSVLTVQG